MRRHPYASTCLPLKVYERFVHVDTCGGCEYLCYTFQFREEGLHIHSML